MTTHVKYVMTGVINSPPYQRVTWTVWDTPDMDGSESGFSDLIDIAVDYQVIDEVTSGGNNGVGAQPVIPDPPTPLVVKIEYIMKATTVAAPFTLVTWKVPDTPDWTGAYSGYASGELENICVDYTEIDDVNRGPQAVPQINELVGPAGGDLDGSYPNPTVIGINGDPIDFTGLAANFFLVYNGTQWVMQQVGSGTFAAGGDLSGTDINQTVIGLRTKSLATALASIGAAQDGYVLTWNNSANEWQALVPVDQFTAGGDLTGTDTNQTVVGIQTNDVKSEVLGASHDGYLLKWVNSNSRWEALPPPSTTPTGAAGGDLTGTYPNPTLNSIKGNGLAGVGTLGPGDAGKVLTWNGTGYFEMVATGVTTLAGDVTGASNANTVVKIQNLAWDNATPTDGYIPAWNNAAQEWQFVGGAAAIGTVGGDLYGSLPNPLIHNITGAAGTYTTGIGATLSNEDGYLIHNKLILDSAQKTLYIKGHTAISDADPAYWSCGNVEITGGEKLGQNTFAGRVTIRGGDSQYLVDSNSIIIRGGDGGSTGSNVVISAGRNGGGSDSGIVKINHRSVGDPDTGGTTLASFHRDAISLNAFGSSNGNISLTSRGDTSITSTAGSLSTSINQNTTFTTAQATTITTGTTLTESGAAVSLSATSTLFDIAAGTEFRVAIGGNNQIRLTGDNDLVFNGLLASGPNIYQDGSVSSGTAPTFTIQAQAGASTGNGGNVDIIGGIVSGAGVAGNVVLKTGATPTARLTANNTGVITIHNLSTGLVHADSSGNLTSSLLVNADVDSAAAIAVSKLAAGTAAQILLNNSTPTPTWTTVSQDATISNTGAVTVQGLRTKALDADLATIGAAQDGYFLSWVNADSEWQAKPASSVVIALSGDVTGNSNANSVVKIRGKNLAAALATIGAGEDQYALTWDNAASEWQAKSVSTITWANDLAGSTDTNQIVVKLTGAGGTLPIESTAATIEWENGAYNPTLTMADSSGLAYDMTIRAQSSTTVVGASLNLQAGNGVGSAGSTVGGSIVLEPGTFTGSIPGRTLIKDGSGSGIIITPTGGNGTIQFTNTSIYGTGIIHSDSSGVLSSSLIINADVSSSAAIAVSKLAAGTSAQFLLNNSTPTPTWTSMSGDISLDNAGATTTVAMRGKTLATSLASVGASQDGYVLTWVNGSSEWQAKPGTGGSGVTTVGTIDSQTKSANGLVISGSNIYAQTADATYPGLMSTGTQTIAGAKTFSGTFTTQTTTNLGSSTTKNTYSGGQIVETFTCNSSLTLGDGYYQVFVDTSAARSITLPVPANGREFWITDVIGTAETNNITLVRNGSEKINGITASKVLKTNWGSWRVISNGTDWFVMG